MKKEKSKIKFCSYYSLEKILEILEIESLLLLYKIQIIIIDTIMMLQSSKKVKI